MIVTKEIREALIAWRTKNKYSLRTMSDEIGIAVNSIQNWLKNDNAEMRQSTYLKLKPLIEPYFTSSISDSDLPIKRYHEDTYITMVLSKDEDAEKEGCHPYEVNIKEDGEYLYALYYMELADAKLAFDMIYRGL